MQPEARGAAHLWDMLKAAEEVVLFTTGGSLREFLSEEARLVRLAVEREFESLGEAARRITPSFREAHPEVQWRETMGLRNVISQEYDR